jgi:hypothetical protein
MFESSTQSFEHDAVWVQSEGQRQRIASSEYRGRTWFENDVNPTPADENSTVAVQPRST